MKIIIYAVIDIDPARRSALLASFQDLLPKVLSQDGCLRYDWGADSADPARLLVYEEWRDEAALAGHFSGPHYAIVGSAVREAGITAANARKFRIDAEAPVFDDSQKPSALFPN